MSKLVIREMDSGALYVVMDNVWRFVDMFQHGIITDEMRIFFQTGLDEDFGVLAFLARECGLNGEETILIADKFMASYVLVRP